MCHTVDSAPETSDNLDCLGGRVNNGLRGTIQVTDENHMRRIFAEYVYRRVEAGGEEIVAFQFGDHH